MYLLRKNAMISYNKEYFKNNCYFFLKDKGEDIDLYYSVSETLTESRKEDEKVKVPKKNLSKLKKVMSKYMDKKENPKKDELKKEIDELVDYDGTMLSSKVPFLDMTLHPHKTMDQTISMSRVTNDPVTRGYRVYWGESEDKKDDVISEIDYSDAFGYEETEDKDFKGTVDTLEKMGVDNAEERALQFGKMKKEKVKKDNKGRKVLKQRLVEKDKLDEIQKEKMRKMVEDILVKKNQEKEINEKEKPISKIIKKNIQSLKKLAKKEGIDLNALLKSIKDE